jgi:hypothetical protein
MKKYIILCFAGILIVGFVFFQFWCVSDFKANVVNRNFHS